MGFEIFSRGNRSYYIILIPPIIPLLIFSPVYQTPFSKPETLFIFSFLTISFYTITTTIFTDRTLESSTITTILAKSKSNIL